MGHNDVKYPFALSKANIYYIIYQKCITIEEFENEKMADQYQYLYKKDSELKGFDYENGDPCDDPYVDYGNDFLSYKIIHSKQ